MPNLFNSPPRQTFWLALLLGLLGDQLSFGVGFTGPVVLIWLGSLVLCAGWLARNARWLRSLLLWGAIAVLAAGLRLWLAFPVVDVALFLVIGTAAAQILLRTAGLGYLQADLYQQLLAFVRVPLQALLGSFSIVGRLEFKPAPAHPAIMGALRGLLLASPLLLVFSLLFAAADVTFENYLSQLPDTFSLNTLQHGLLVLWLGWLALGLLAAAWQARTTHPSPTLTVKLGNAETLMMMGLLALLFLAFAGLQLSHLLHDGAGIAQTTGLTIAEYARHGFFQLLFIAALALAMLLLLSGCCSNRRLFAGFAGLLLVCVLIVLASAVQRMLFYLDSFGLSIDRVIASMVMLWLCGSLFLFAATVLRNRPAGFVSSVITLGIGVCFGLTLLNPAALVTRVNIERSLSQQQALDADYLFKLGADAVPDLLAYFPQLPSATQCELGMVLLANWVGSNNSNALHLQDWRHWNRAYHLAQSLVQANSQQLLVAAQRTGNPYYSSIENLYELAPGGLKCQ